MANNLKRLDGLQVLRSVYDQDKNRLRVDAEVTAVISQVEVVIDHTEDNIRLGDGTKLTTATTANSKTGLDSYIINSDLDIRDLVSTQDNVALKDEDGHLMDIDTDGNAHIEVHGNTPTNVDAILRLSETGEVAIDGTYDATNNTNPANIGIVTQERNVSPGDTLQTERLTSIENSAGDSRSLDISTHDKDGEGIDSYVLADGNRLLRVATNSATLEADTVDSVAVPADLLIADEEYTGPWIDATGYVTSSITIRSDVASSNNGLIFEYSIDGITKDDSDEYNYSGANNGVLYTVPLNTKYFRVRYINGPIAQSVFRLEVRFFSNSPKPSSHRIADSINGENDAELSKSVVTGKDVNGIFVNLPAGGVSDDNSTVTPLGISETFTGSYVDQSGYGGVTVSVLSDKSGTLFLDTSSDGITVISSDSYPIIANSPFFTGASPKNRYLRVRYVNDAVAQTSFNLQTLFFTQQLSPSSQPINTDLSSDSIAVNTRSVLTGQQENGDFSNVSLSNSSSLEVAITDRPSEVRDRVRKAITFENTTPGVSTVYYTVTAGYVLYITSIFITALSTANQIGRAAFTDNGAIVLPMILPERVLGAPAGVIAPSPGLPEPARFTTNITGETFGGSVTLSFTLIGYEEPI